MTFKKPKTCNEMAAKDWNRNFPINLSKELIVSIEASICQSKMEGNFLGNLVWPLLWQFSSIQLGIAN